MFRIPIIDPATPSFVSASTDLYADPDEAKHLLELRQQMLQEAYTPDDELCRVIDRLLSGHGTVKTNVAFPNQMTEDVGEPLAQRTVRLSHVNHDHTNVWNFVYKVRLDNVRLDMAWLEDKGIPLRVTSVTAKSITIDQRPVTKAWGTTGVVETEDGHIRTNAHLIDITFGSISEMRTDISNPTTDPSVSHAMDALIGQIVADG